MVSWKLYKQWGVQEKIGSNRRQIIQLDRGLFQTRHLKSYGGPVIHFDVVKYTVGAEP